jgi:hypothetical protein
MLTTTRNRSKYDLPTAVTFLFAGLALGWVAALIFPPRTGDMARRPRTVSGPQSIADEVFLG